MPKKGDREMEEQLQEVELDLETTLKQVREEIRRLQDHEAALVMARDAKIAEEEARRPKTNLAEEVRKVTQRSQEEKLRRLQNGYSPLSDLDQYYANRGRAR